MRNYSTEAEPTTLVGPWLEPLLPELIAFRRDLHAHPELSFKEFRTTDKLAKRLEEAGLKPRRLEGTGLTVDIGDGPIATALRGDIDALPDHRGDGPAVRLEEPRRHPRLRPRRPHRHHARRGPGPAAHARGVAAARHRPDHLPAGRGNHARRRPELHRAGRPRRRSADPGPALRPPDRGGQDRHPDRRHHLRLGHDQDRTHRPRRPHLTPAPDRRARLRPGADRGQRPGRAVPPGGCPQRRVRRLGPHLRRLRAQRDPGQRLHGRHHALPGPRRLAQRRAKSSTRSSSRSPHRTASTSIWSTPAACLRW